MLFSTDMGQLACVSRAAAAFARENDLATISCGRHEVGGGDYVNVMEYDTVGRLEKPYEAHRDYVDIQVVVAGAEALEVTGASGLKVTSPYDEADDAELYDAAAPGELFLMRPGRFCLVVPGDAHKPGVTLPGGSPAHVRKAVFKVRVDHLEPLALA